MTQSCELKKDKPILLPPSGGLHRALEDFFFKISGKLSLKGNETYLSLDSKTKLIPGSVEPKRAFGSCSTPATDWGPWPSSPTSLLNQLFGPDNLSCLLRQLL